LIALVVVFIHATTFDAPARADAGLAAVALASGGHNGSGDAARDGRSAELRSSSGKLLPALPFAILAGDADQPRLLFLGRQLPPTPFQVTALDRHWPGRSPRGSPAGW
jgi:hypothetical protein